MPDHNSPVYLLLGATGGIGSTVSRQLAQQGAHLVLAARSEDPLRTLADDLGADAHPLDATDFDAVQDLINRIVEEHGRLDGVANCIGSILLKPAHLTSVKEYRETLAKNLDTAFFTIKAAARPMMKTGGSIVLCSSAVARTGLVNHEAIAAAKSGIEGLVRAAAATYAHRGVRVNAVAPGLVETPATERITSSEAGRKQSEAMHALGRLGQPEDIAEVIGWLLDAERSGWVTGQVIGVDGGLSTLRPR